MNGTAADTEDHEDAAVEETLRIEDLLQRANTLLTELQSLHCHLQRTHKPSDTVAGLQQPFEAEIRSERKFLDSLRELPGDHNEGNSTTLLQHKLRSANLPFYEAVWAEAKRVGQVRGLRQRVLYRDTGQGNDESCEDADGEPRSGGDVSPSDESNCKARRANAKSKRVDVDVVADDGAEWIKVSLMSEKHLLYDMAKEGWDFEDQDSTPSEEDDTSARSSQRTEIASLPLHRTAMSLLAAAGTKWIRYRHPRVRIILPRIRLGRVSEIDRLLDEIRKLGCRVDTATASDRLRTSPSLSEALPRFISNPTRRFACTLNIDCSILVALMSDISHTSDLSPPPWASDNIRMFVGIEAKERLLPRQLYPLMEGRRLVCTREAAKKMREIVSTIGTETERKRAELLLNYHGQTRSEETNVGVKDRLGSLSEYEVPTDLLFPIEVVDESDWSLVHPASDKSCLENSVMSEVSANLTRLNKNIFMFGWVTGFTTLTSNRAVAKQIESSINRILARREASDSTAVSNFAGPSIWVNAKARSLVGREKESVQKGGKARAVNKSDE